MKIFSAVLLATLLLPAAISAQTLEKMKETGQLVVGFREDAAPMSFLENNQPKGFAPELCFALAPSLAVAAGIEDLNVVFEVVTADNRFDKIAAGEVDLLCGAASITLSRREIVDFSIPVFVDGTTVALKKDGPVDFAGLAGKKVGVRGATTTLEALENSLASMGIEAEVIQFDDHPSGMAALDADVITAYFADQTILMRMVLTSPNADNFKVLDRVLTVEKQGLAMRRGDPDFRLAVDRGLSALYQQGVVEEIFRENLPGAQPGPALEAMFMLSPVLP